VRKIKLEIAYDGTDFHGFAKQKELRTVQGTLEAILERIAGRPVEVLGSGRTDAGVHARAQVVHFVLDGGPPTEKMVYILSRMLPRDIVPIRACDASNDFHARFSTLQKTYRYTIQRATVEDVFSNRYAWHITSALDIVRMKEAAVHFVGEHDFTSFCAASTPIQNKIRTIFELNLEEHETYLHIFCTGSGFLQNMVRIIVGTLVDIGQGRYVPFDVVRMLEAQDRRIAGKTAPALGLCMWNVVYPEGLEIST
jgi:tRNA pseudouridine38-40 synthase